MARSGARSLRTLLVVLFVMAGIAGIGVVLWSLRPTPSYSSEAVEEGSPFDVTFRVENRNRWFALADLEINCVLAHVRASGTPPTMIEATDLRFPTAGARGLAPGETAIFTCPFRTFIDHPIYQDAGVAQRAEIYFRARYALPVVGWRITDNSPNFFLNTRLLPPRWTARPPG